MIILDSTSKSLVAVLAGAKATNDAIFTVAYADTDGTTFTEASADGVLNGVTEVALVAAPATNHRRIIRSVTIYNADTAAITPSVSLKNGASVRTIKKKALAVGDSLILGIAEPLSSSSLGLSSADSPTFAGLTVGSLAGILFGTAGVLSAKGIADSQTAIGLGSEVGPTTTTTQTSTVDCGTVTAGDRILLLTNSNIAATNLAVPYCTIDKSAGSATIVIQPSVNNNLPFHTPGAGAAGISHFLIQVTGSGTLTLRQTLNTAGGTGITYPDNTIFGYFLKKQ